MMKNKMFFAITILIGMIALFGCSDNQQEEKQVQEASLVEAREITVEERTVDGYKTTKVIDNKDELKSVEKILVDADWEGNIEVSMDLPPEYRFSLNSSNYAIWVTPNGDRLEIVIEGETKYINLPENESETLFELITGN
ncbi:hypothetical protein [Halalkalibacter hemicellulosilyticus]|uniref:Lipoprotein n=1 Tax=Halalkalibacter hemicellulosilyticusJCM 9152 TaxID=1236971 RepID=W4QIA4_9BACI|nr:hypothetical protein [Halalkalibacter hemicellulosilyticus]GAE31627.1 lipoprotein [Halalkalibacter hemicellulosilyticusJCM 9152]